MSDGYLPDMMRAGADEVERMVEQIRQLKAENERLRGNVDQLRCALVNPCGFPTHWGPCGECENCKHIEDALIATSGKRGE